MTYNKTYIHIGIIYVCLALINSKCMFLGEMSPTVLFSIPNKRDKNNNTRKWVTKSLKMLLFSVHIS